MERRKTMPDMRMDMSKKNKYYIDKDRKYELIHFCKQYPKWKSALFDVEGWSVPPVEQTKINTGNYVPDPVARAAAIKKFYSDRIDMIQKAAYQSDPELCEYIIKGVCWELPYDNLAMMYSIPCSRDTYYDRRAKFLWILDKLRE